jgi:hypothetical protein
MSRRGFVGRVLTATGVAGAAGLPFGSVAAAAGAEVGSEGALAPGNGVARRKQAYRVRVAAAAQQRESPVPSHPDNGDEARYPNRIGSYSKGLPHDDRGEVDQAAYDALLRAVAQRRPEEFEAIPMGCPTGRRLVNPQAGLSFELEGGDAAAFFMPPAPAFASAERHGEMVELYWQALLRDVPFSEYPGHPLARAAAADLTRLSDFRGPKVGDRVTPKTLFRNVTPGDTVGPWVSQFFYKPMPIGSSHIEARMRTPLPALDFVTDYAEWLNLQRGCQPSVRPQHDPVWRYPRTGRDLAGWVHMDLIYQAYFQAMVCLLAGPSDDPHLNGMAAPFDANNPYFLSRNQEGFVTFGAPHIASLLCEVAARCMKAQWFQKWFVHRALRPEVYAGRVHNHLAGRARYPLSAELLESPALGQVFDRHGTYLLPLAFPEGSPLHPAYGSGHATVAGACVTILKAWFDEDWVVPDPVVPAPDGLSLVPYEGPALRLGGELNKLASNVAMGRNFAGIHYRSDAIEAMKLGEAVAVSILRDHRLLYNERFEGFTFRNFDGIRVVV